MKVTKAILSSTVFLLIITIGVVIYQFVILPTLSVKEVSGCVPMRFKKEEIDSVYYLTWVTKDECTGYVRYGTSQNSYPYLALDQQGVTKLKNHSVRLNGIEKNNKFYFIIVSDEKSYGIDDNSIYFEF